MRTQQLLVAALAIVAVLACRKTEDGDLEVDRPVVGSEKDTIIDTLIINKPVVGTEKDTIHTPDIEFGTTKDTIVVDRPTVRVNRDTTPK